MVAARTRASTAIKRPAADPFDLTFLQKAQELHLQSSGQFSNLIEKQCSALGHLDAALSLHVSTSERSLFVAEQFALQKALRELRRN